MKKILVCGAAGFLMSNFMRYVIHRTDCREYRFASIDRLRTPQEHGMVYIKPDRHAFYIGDVRDRHLMERVLYIEKPDVVVNGIREEEDGEAAAAAYTLSSMFDGKLVHLQCADRAGVVNATPAKIVELWDGVILQLPDCFGMRDRHGLMARIMKYVLDPDSRVRRRRSDEDLQEAARKRRWVYAEDVASMLWYIIENIEEPCTIEMPPLATASASGITQLVSEAVLEPPGYDGLWDHEDNPDPSWKEWKPDSASFQEAIEKTAKWYNKNRWILPMVEAFK